MLSFHCSSSPDMMLERKATISNSANGEYRHVQRRILEAWSVGTTLEYFRNNCLVGALPAVRASAKRRMSQGWFLTIYSLDFYDSNNVARLDTLANP